MFKTKIIIIKINEWMCNKIPVFNKPHGLRYHSCLQQMIEIVIWFMQQKKEYAVFLLFFYVEEENRIL